MLDEQLLTKYNQRNPGAGLRVRSLNINDYDRGFLELLGQLTSVGHISREAWTQRYKMKIISSLIK